MCVAAANDEVTFLKMNEGKMKFLACVSGFPSVLCVSVCLSVCVSSSSKEGFRSVEKVVLLTFLSAVILMAILGNLLVMVAVCRDRQLR